MAPTMNTILAALAELHASQMAVREWGRQYPCCLVEGSDPPRYTTRDPALAEECDAAWIIVHRRREAAIARLSILAAELAAGNDTDDTTAPTPDQIRALSYEAGQAGDMAMVEVCRRALDGDRAAVARCAAVIADAGAQS